MGFVEIFHKIKRLQTQTIFNNHNVNIFSTFLKKIIH